MKPSIALFDVVINILGPQRERGLQDVNVVEIHRTLMRWVRGGHSTDKWSSDTARRVAPPTRPAKP